MSNVIHVTTGVAFTRITKWAFWGLFLLGCLMTEGLGIFNTSYALADEGSQVVGEVDAEAAGRIIGRFRNTHYYVTLEDDYANDRRDTNILTMDDQVIAIVSRRFKIATDIEGTGKLMDGRVINYAGRKNGEIRYHVTRHPFGHGVGDCELVPFRTVAVDKSRIPLGSIVQIDETVGMLLPDGTRHDGLWRAEDVGGAIKRDRVDLFIGLRANFTYLQDAGIHHLKALTVRQVAPPASNSCVDAVMAQ